MMELNLKLEEKAIALLPYLPYELGIDIMKYLTDAEQDGVKHIISGLPNTGVDIVLKLINEFFPDTITMKDKDTVREYFISKARENPAMFSMLIQYALTGKFVTFNELNSSDMQNSSVFILEQIEYREKLADRMLEEVQAMVKDMLDKAQKKCDLMIEECKNKGKQLMKDVKHRRSILIEDTERYCTGLTEDAKNIYEQKEMCDIEEARKKWEKIVQETAAQAKTIREDGKIYSEKLYKFAEHEAFEEWEVRGMEEGKKEGIEILKSAFEIKNYFSEERNKFFSHIDSQIAGMAITVAEKTIKKPVTADRNTILNLAEERLKEARNEGEIIFRVNPEDYNYLKGNENEIRNMVAQVKDVRIEDDERVEKGTCIIATTLLDCSRIEFHLKTLKLLF